MGLKAAGTSEQFGANIAGFVPPTQRVNSQPE